MSSLTEEQARSLESLYPWPTPAGVERFAASMDALILAEKHRKWHPEATTGALHKLALTQGGLLDAEYDLATHGHLPAWSIGAMGIDVRALIRLNAEFGFAFGDEVLRRTVQVLSHEYPKAKVVRIHSDCFAVLFAPSAQTTVSLAMREHTRKALLEAAPAGTELDYTLSLLQLEIESPSHPQVLGPLVWAEAERAHVVERRAGGTGIQHRKLSLNGAVP